jgi:hypothetical protein
LRVSSRTSVSAVTLKVFTMRSNRHLKKSSIRHLPPERKPKVRLHRRRGPP